MLRYQEMTQVPLAPDVIEGLINLRGQIVTALDMRRRLKLKPRAEGQTPMNTVVRTKEGGAVSLLVDEIGDVVEVDSEKFERTPDEKELNELQRNGNKRWDLGWVYTVIAGVLNIMVIYDAVAGPAFLLGGDKKAE